MNENENLRFLEEFRAKGNNFSKREIFIREMDNFDNKTITKISEKISPLNENGEIEDLHFEIINEPDCKCRKEIAGSCAICHRTVCQECKKNLILCENCGVMVCKQHSRPSFIDKKINYCVNCRFSFKRLFWK